MRARSGTYTTGLQYDLGLFAGHFTPDLYHRAAETPQTLRTRNLTGPDGVPACSRAALRRMQARLGRGGSDALFAGTAGDHRVRVRGTGVPAGAAGGAGPGSSGAPVGGTGGVALRGEAAGGEHRAPPEKAGRSSPVTSSPGVLCDVSANVSSFYSILNDCLTLVSTCGSVSCDRSVLVVGSGFLHDSDLVHSLIVIM